MRPATRWPAAEWTPCGSVSEPQLGGGSLGCGGCARMLRLPHTPLLCSDSDMLAPLTGQCDGDPAEQACIHVVLSGSAT
jgi:hypothetical protein